MDKITLTSKGRVHTVQMNGKFMDSFSTLWEAFEYAYSLSVRRARSIVEKP